MTRFSGSGPAAEGGSAWVSGAATPTQRAREARARVALAAGAELGRNLLVVDAPSHTIVAASPSFAELFGYEPAELVGRSSWELVVSSPERLEDVHARLLENGELAEVVTAVHRDGHQFQFAYVVRDVGGFGVLVGEPVVTRYEELDLDSPMLPLVVDLLEERAGRLEPPAQYVGVDDGPLVVSREQAARMLSVSVRTVDRLRRDGELVDARVSPGRVGILRRSVEQRLRRGGPLTTALVVVAVILLALLVAQLFDLVWPDPDFGFAPGTAHALHAKSADPL